MRDGTQRYGRWLASFLLETTSVDEDRWPMASLYNTVLDDPMAGASFFPRVAALGPGRLGSGVPRVVRHGGGSEDMPDWIEVVWVVNGEAVSQVYDREGTS
jgi:hypothetical protein